jgi:hypothetical protein
LTCAMHLSNSKETIQKVWQDFCDMCVNDYEIKKSALDTKSASECNHRVCTPSVGKFN